MFFDTSIPSKKKKNSVRYDKAINDSKRFRLIDQEASADEVLENEDGSAENDIHKESSAHPRSKTMLNDVTNSFFGSEVCQTIESLESHIGHYTRGTETTSEKKRKEYSRRAILNRPRKKSFARIEVCDLSIACMRK